MQSAGEASVVFAVLGRWFSAGGQDCPPPLPQDIWQDLQIVVAVMTGGGRSWNLAGRVQRYCPTPCNAQKKTHSTRGSHPNVNEKLCNR